MTLKALEGFDEKVFAYCLDMPNTTVYYMSWRLIVAIRKVLEKNKGYPWKTVEEIYGSFGRALESEITDEAEKKCFSRFAYLFT